MQDNVINGVLITLFCMQENVSLQPRNICFENKAMIGRKSINNVNSNLKNQTICVIFHKTVVFLGRISLYC